MTTSGPANIRPLLSTSCSGWGAVVLICGTVACLLSAATAMCGDVDANAALHISPFGRIATQPFAVGVVSQKYGLFNATLRLKSSLHFPEYIYGELIPVGEQRRKSSDQISLQHFNHSRRLHRETPPPPETVGAHPSLLAVNIRLESNDAGAGALTAWALPADTELLARRLSEIEAGDATPTARANFDFLHEQGTVSPSAPGDSSPVARAATGVVHLENGSTGTFTFRLLSEREFSLTVQIPGGDGAADLLWVYGHAALNRALFPRDATNPKSWWRTHALLITTIFFFVVRFVTAFRNARRVNEVAQKQPSLGTAVKKKK